MIAFAYVTAALLSFDQSQAVGPFSRRTPAAFNPPAPSQIPEFMGDEPIIPTINMDEVGTWEPITEVKSYEPGTRKEGDLIPVNVILDPQEDAPYPFEVRWAHRNMLRKHDSQNYRIYQDEQMDDLARNRAMECLSTSDGTQYNGAVYATAQRAVYFHPDRSWLQIKQAYRKNDLPVLRKDSQGQHHFTRPRDEDHPNLAELVDAPADPGYEHIPHRPTVRSHYDDESDEARETWMAWGRQFREQEEREKREKEAKREARREKVRAKMMRGSSSSHYGTSD